MQFTRPWGVPQQGQRVAGERGPGERSREKEVAGVKECSAVRGPRGWGNGTGQPGRLGQVIPGEGW